MTHLDALDLLRCHAPISFGWAEVVVGHDFGLLSLAEIQAWVRSQPPLGPEARKLAALSGQELLRFEETLWAACVEATGTRLPRPGHRRWALAQDLWRTALLKEALLEPLDEAGFGEAVETIVDRVGCPEDMHGLLHRGQAWARTRARADRLAVMTFVAKLERSLLDQETGWRALAAS
ncbi:MAG TPA: hypothetical protein VN436_02220 [Holophaga sp.]|nr:hypothetical protein [Holophaga sp.]